MKEKGRKEKRARGEKILTLALAAKASTSGRTEHIVGESGWPCDVLKMRFHGSHVG
jgi:hypothetical protein